jgi:hypothetical protein
VRPARPYLGGLLRLGFAALLVVFIVASYFALPWLRTRGARLVRLRQWFDDPAAHPEWSVQAGGRCGEAPFLLPTDGYIGFTWGDSFRPGHSHQGIDIFGGQEPGQTPVVAAYSGYLTRLPEWKSSLIIRVPSDPLAPGRQIWLYYTPNFHPAPPSSIFKLGHSWATRATIPATRTTPPASTCTSPSCWMTGRAASATS